MEMLDMLILGSGPAGMAAAIYASRAELNFLVIERSIVSGGQVQQTYEVDNYPGIPGVSGPDLSQKMREHCEKLGVEFVTEEVKSVERLANSGFSVKTWDGNEYTAKTVIAATGASHSTLGVPGEEVLQGMGVSYCATCDGAFFKNKVCSVVGGGDVAVEDAIYLSKLCTKVYLIHRRDEFRAAGTLVSEARGKENIEFVTSTVVNSIQGTNKVEKIEILDKKTGETRELACDGVRVTAVCPGPVNTEFQVNATDGKTTEFTGFRKFIVADPDKLAQASLKAHKNGRCLYVYGISQKLLHVVSMIVPISLMLMFMKVDKEKN